MIDFEDCEYKPSADDIHAENRRLRAENARLREALNNIEAYVDGRVIAHRDIAEMAESSASGKKQRVRLSEASDILGKIHAARVAMGENDE